MIFLQLVGIIVCKLLSALKRLTNICAALPRRYPFGRFGSILPSFTFLYGSIFKNILSHFRRIFEKYSCSAGGDNLIETNDSFTSIALEHGFSGLRSMNRALKQVLGKMLDKFEIIQIVEERKWLHF